MFDPRKNGMQRQAVSTFSETYAALSLDSNSTCQGKILSYNSGNVASAAVGGGVAATATASSHHSLHNAGLALCSRLKASESGCLILLSMLPSKVFATLLCSCCPVILIPRVGASLSRRFHSAAVAVARRTMVQQHSFKQAVAVGTTAVCQQAGYPAQRPSTTE